MQMGDGDRMFIEHIKNIKNAWKGIEAERVFNPRDTSGYHFTIRLPNYTIDVYPNGRVIVFEHLGGSRLLLEFFWFPNTHDIISKNTGLYIKNGELIVGLGGVFTAQFTKDYRLIINRVWKSATTIYFDMVE